MAAKTLNLSCSFCGKRQQEVKKLIAGAGEPGVVVYICDACVSLCNGILAEAGPDEALGGQTSDARCSFCAASLARVTLIAGPPGPPPLFICDECIGLCNDILADERHGLIL